MTHTYPGFLDAIARGEMNPDLQADAAELLEKHNKAAANRTAKAAEKRAAENAPLVEAVTDLLKANEGHVYTAAEVKNLVDGIDSTSKATFVLKAVEGIKVSDVVVDKRVVKGYSL